MNLDELIKRIASRPTVQRLFFAFTLAVFMSCSMKVAAEAPDTTVAGFSAP